MSASRHFPNSYAYCCPYMEVVASHTRIIHAMDCMPCKTTRQNFYLGGTWVDALPDQCESAVPRAYLRRCFFQTLYYAWLHIPMYSSISEQPPVLARPFSRFLLSNSEHFINISPY